MENELQLALPSPTTSCISLLDLQKELFLGQIDQLHNIAANQCKLTGVNPLSQGMAAGALSKKIGKRPRDLLKPKAIKHMQSVFSIKDTVNKKEAHEISVLYGITVTQVRDFFTAQRTRVRKLLRLSGEKASTSNAPSEGPCVIPLSSEPNIQTEPVPLDSVAPTCTEEGPSCSTQDEVLTGIGELGKLFISNILNLMRKVETFSGQIKFMNWILQVQTRSVLCWFLNNGGVTILATWLSQAAAEEQTSVLDVILKVLCHLPIEKAFPAHMSAILLSVNSLRFYQTTDISRRARQLLAKWSKMCAKREAMMKRNGIKSRLNVCKERGYDEKREAMMKRKPEAEKRKRYRRMQISWEKPPVMKMSQTWEICSGSGSKEVEIQNERTLRERETIYRTVQEIPLNPKEPWDREMDPDDTLTTEIPIERLPNAEGAETVVLPPEVTETETKPVSASNGSVTTAETDAELLRILLENPNLVYALTPGEGENLSEETVKLLDMIKANGVNALSSIADIGKNAEKKVEVSLPSSTPSGDPGTSGSNLAKNPLSQRIAMVVPEANGAAQLGALSRSHPQVASTTMVTSQQLSIAPQLAQQLSLLQEAAGSFGNDHQSSPLNPSINHSALANPMQSQLSASEAAVSRNSYFVYGSTDYNPHSAYASAAATRMQSETYSNILSSPTPIDNYRALEWSLSSGYRGPNNGASRRRGDGRRYPGRHSGYRGPNNGADSRRGGGRRYPDHHSGYSGAIRRWGGGRR